MHSFTFSRLLLFEIGADGQALMTINTRKSKLRNSSHSETIRCREPEHFQSELIENICISRNEKENCQMQLCTDRRYTIKNGMYLVQRQFPIVWQYWNNCSLHTFFVSAYCDAINSCSKLSALAKVSVTYVVQCQVVESDVHCSHRKATPNHRWNQLPLDSSPCRRNAILDGWIQYVWVLRTLLCSI